MTDPLAALGLQAVAYARCYVQLTEALLAEGVREEQARSEARATALMMIVYEHALAEGEPCGLCGRS